MGHPRRQLPRGSVPALQGHPPLHCCRCRARCSSTYFFLGARDLNVAVFRLSDGSRRPASPSTTQVLGWSWGRGHRLAAPGASPRPPGPAQLPPPRPPLSLFWPRLLLLRLRRLPPSGLSPSPAPRSLRALALGAGGDLPLLPEPGRLVHAFSWASSFVRLPGEEDRQGSLGATSGTP